MNLLQKKYEKALEDYRIFQILQKAQNIDFTKNMPIYHEINLNILLEYCNKNFFNLNYTIKFDNYLTVLVYNYLASVKAYINRKYKLIEKNISAEPYQNNAKSIFNKYYSSKKNNTVIEKVVNIRNIFEHEEVTNMVMERKIKDDKVFPKLMIDGEDILLLFSNCNNELIKMSKELEEYIECEIKKFNLRDIILFLNAFNIRFKGKKYSELDPEETLEEKEKYEKIIEELYNKV